MTFLAGAVALLLLWWFGRNLKIRHPALTARVLRQVGGYAALSQYTAPGGQLTVFELPQ